VSALSVNLIASLAMPSFDSSRVVRLAVAPPVDAARAPSRDGEERAVTERHVLTTAGKYVGVRYRLGGTKPAAFDCSGFVRYVFGRHGVALPRTAKEQAATGRTITVGLDSLEVGDLLFFRTPRGRAGHVAIYAGDGRIIHASAGSRRVRYDDLASPRGRWFIEHLSGVRRILDAPVVETTEPDTGGRQSRIRAGA
jgi:cell wall-associated NlpC family hydrolase